MLNKKIIKLENCSFAYKQRSQFTFKKANINKINSETILKNISLQLYENKIYGLIGKNGAGKSTLIKLLLGVLKQSTGSIEKNYFNSKLLDEPLFFHTELSSLQNFEALSLVESKDMLSLNKFEERLENFCEISQLTQNDLKKPISHLSRGSKSKVGFALTMTFLEGIDFLGLDEFFSFGDEKYKEFSSDLIRKKIQNSKSSVIVSHSMKVIEDTCDEVIVINNGTIETIDLPVNAIKLYSRLN